MKSADFYAATAERNQTPIDLETLPNILGASKLKSDLIHPNEAGYRQLAEKILIY